MWLNVYQILLYRQISQFSLYYLKLNTAESVLALFIAEKKSLRNLILDSLYQGIDSESSNCWSKCKMKGCLCVLWGGIRGCLWGFSGVIWSSARTAQDTNYELVVPKSSKYVKLTIWEAFKQGTENVTPKSEGVVK